MSKVKDLETPTQCRWWLLCDKSAFQTLSHPILGDVPICGRCLEKVNAIEYTN